MSATPSTKLRTGLAEVFQTFGAEYLDAHGLTAPQAKVFRAVLDCRTAALGGHCLECDTCGHRDYVYHSCRNRHCPNCQTRAKGGVVPAAHDRAAAGTLCASGFHPAA